MGTRFIEAYNGIDKALRTQYNFKTTISFTDLIRRCSSLNHVIKTYEDDLVDFARLRNAIIHNSNSNQVIAEPHPNVVDLLEKIERLITTPPSVFEMKKSNKVVIFDASKKLRDIICDDLCYKHGLVPAYKKGILVGVIRWRDFIGDIGNVIKNGQSADEFINKTTIEQYMRDNPGSGLFTIASKGITIESCISLFNQSKSLSCVIITQNGLADEPPLGIVTGSDILDLVLTLENY